jgi:hypothetical protein
MKEGTIMANEGDAIVGTWRCEFMGAVMKLQFDKEEENKYDGRLIEAKIPAGLAGLVERKFKGRKELNPEDLYGSNLFCLIYNPVKRAYNLGELENPFVNLGRIPFFYRGLLAGFEVNTPSSDTLIFKTKTLGFSRQITLKKEVDESAVDLEL